MEPNEKDIETLHEVTCALIDAYYPDTEIPTREEIAVWIKRNDALVNFCTNMYGEEAVEKLAEEFIKSKGA